MTLKNLPLLTMLIFATACGSINEAIDANTTELSSMTERLDGLDGRGSTHESDLIALADRVSSNESTIAELESKVSSLQADVAAIPTFAYQQGRADGGKLTFEKVEATGWKTVADMADEVQLETSGGDVIVQMHFPLILREASVHYGITLDRRPQGPVKHCGRVSARESGTVEFASASCVMIFRNLDAGTHTFGPSISVEGDYIEAHFLTRYAMTAIEVP
ncbi:MAG: hypothetical protein ACI9MC_000626 [Kiritimatiellia bacterium]|jgi:hypothetical protein